MFYLGQWSAAWQPSHFDIMHIKCKKQTSPWYAEISYATFYSGDWADADTECMLYVMCNPLCLTSAYTEAYNVCSMAVAPQSVSVGDAGGETVGEDDQGRTSEEEEGGLDNNYDRQVSSNKCILYL